jgi:hypothetical protein
MTQDKPHERWTAHDVWTRLAEKPEYRCDMCHEADPQAANHPPDHQGSDAESIPAPVSTGVSTATYHSASETPVPPVTFSAGNPTGRIYYTTWTWSEAHKQYYTYLMSRSTGRVLDTRWSGSDRSQG